VSERQRCRHRLTGVLGHPRCLVILNVLFTIVAPGELGLWEGREEVVHLDSRGLLHWRAYVAVTVGKRRAIASVAADSLFIDGLVQILDERMIFDEDLRCVHVRWHEGAKSLESTPESRVHL